MSACVSANAGDCRFFSEKPETMVCGSRSFQFFPFALYYVFVHMGYPFSGQSPLYCRYVGALSGYTGCALWDEKEKDKL